MRIGMPMPEARLLCCHHCQKQATGPTMPQFPQCEDKETVPCREVGFEEDHGESSMVKTAEVHPRPGLSALGRLDFSLVLLGLSTLRGSMAATLQCQTWQGTSEAGGGLCSPRGQAAPPSPAPCTHTLQQPELLPPAAPCPASCSGHGGFSQELGWSRRWLPWLPQLVAALRSDTPAHTVPNSQLIHQLGSPGGFPRSRCPAKGFQCGQGTGPLRTQPPGAIFCRVPGGRPEGLHHKRGIGGGSPWAPRGSAHELQSSSAQASGEAWSRSLAETSAPLLPLGQVCSARPDGQSPSCYHLSYPDPLSNCGETRCRCPFQPCVLHGDRRRIFQGREQCLSSLCSRASSSQGSSPASSSGVNVPRAW